MKREIALMGALLALGGCAHLQEPAQASATQQQAEVKDLNRAGMQLDLDSERLRNTQDTLTRELEQRSAQPVALAAPENDHLGIPSTGVLVSKKFGMSMQDARIGQLLWIVAMEFGMSLSIDPEVLAADKTMNLYLKDVTGRPTRSLQVAAVTTPFPIWSLTCCWILIWSTWKRPPGKAVVFSGTGQTCTPNTCTDI